MLVELTVSSTHMVKHEVEKQNFPDLTPPTELHELDFKHL